MREQIIPIFVKNEKMVILETRISKASLIELASHIYGDMVKAVVDVDNGILAIDAELHADLERVLLERGCSQESLWGFNLYPEADDEDFIEFDSLINIRPRQGNYGRGVENETVRDIIRSIVNKFIDK